MFDVWSSEFVLSVWTEGKDINGAERRHRVSSSFFSRTPATFPTMASLMGQTIRLSGGVDTRVLTIEMVRAENDQLQIVTHMKKSGSGTNVLAVDIWRRWR